MWGGVSYSLQLAHELFMRFFIFVIVKCKQFLSDYSEQTVSPYLIHGLTCNVLHLQIILKQVTQSTVYGRA